MHYTRVVAIEARRGHWNSGNEVTDVCELLCEYWELVPYKSIKCS